MGRGGSPQEFSYNKVQTHELEEALNTGNDLTSVTIKSNWCTFGQCHFESTQNIKGFQKGSQFSNMWRLI